MKRPINLAEFVGQEKLKPLLTLELKTGFPRSMLVFGGSGLGKTSLAFALSHELSCQFHEHVAQPEWSSEFIIDMLMGLSVNGYDAHGRPGPGADRHIVFIDEAHNLTKCSDALLRPIEDGHVFDTQGRPNWLPKICFMLATTNPEKISVPLRNRLPLQFHLVPYTDSDIASIVKRNFPDMAPELTQDIARRSKGVPRLALSYSESVNLYGGDAETFFSLSGIDAEGLDERDREYMRILHEADRPLSLNSISAALRESPAIVQLMEAHLIFKGFIQIGPKGRTAVQATARGRRAA